MVVMNGNQAMALGIMAAGIEVCSMYPITPATSVSHFLAPNFEQVGGFVHQAEDEIAAIGFAIGCSYAGKTARDRNFGSGPRVENRIPGIRGDDRGSAGRGRRAARRTLPPDCRPKSSRAT